MWFSEELRDVITCKWSLGSNHGAVEALSAGSAGHKNGVLSSGPAKRRELRDAAVSVGW